MLKAMRGEISDWLSKPTNLAMVGTIAVTSLKFANENAQSLTNPWFRWACSLIGLILCIIGILSTSREKTSGIVDAGSGKGAVVKDLWRRDLFVLGAIASSIALCVDVGLNLGGFFPVVHIGDPTVSGGYSFGGFPKPRGVAAVEPILREPLSDKNIAARLEDNYFPAFPSLEFLMQKRESLKELLIDDLVLTVLQYRPKEAVGVHLASSGAVNDEIIVVFELKDLKEPLPWQFRPMGIVFKGEYHRWQKNMISLTEPFTQRLRVSVAAQDACTYEMSLRMIVRSDFSRIDKISVTRKPVTFLYVPPGD